MTSSRALVDPFDLANITIEAHLSQSKPHIYEAGGGSRTRLSSSLMRQAHITVVDVSKEQLDACSYAHEKVLGSVSEWSSAANFDLVSCINVLEHVKDVEGALKNFSLSLKIGGVLYIASPRKYGLQGIITRFTPHFIHVLYYKIVRGKKNAGEPGQAPFPVYFSKGLTYTELSEALGMENLDIKCLLEYEGVHLKILRKKRRYLYIMYRGLSFVVDVLTLWIFKAGLSDFWIVAVKR